MDTCHICIINCTYFAGKFSLSSRKKEKGKQLSMPDVTLQGAIVWIVQVRWCHIKFDVQGTCTCSTCTRFFPSRLRK